MNLPRAAQTCCSPEVLLVRLQRVSAFLGDPVEFHWVVLLDQGDDDICRVKILWWEAAPKMSQFLAMVTEFDQM